MTEALAPYEGQELIVAPTGMASMDALALLSDQEFEARLKGLKLAQDRIARIQREIMTPDVDFGSIPSIPKPTLKKPGAEKLCKIYHLVASFDNNRILGDGQGSPPITYTATCLLHLDTVDGPVVAMGMGSANSWERKYRYRNGERVCPNCGTSGAIIKGREEYGGGWVCFTKRGGCNAKFADSDPSIVDQPLGIMENPDPYDLDNTLLKMAEKRAYIDATLRGTATSGLFTQDLEDAEGEDKTRTARPTPQPTQANPIKAAVAKGQAPKHEQAPLEPAPTAHKAPDPELVKLWNEYLAAYTKARQAGIKDIPTLDTLRNNDSPLSEYRAIILDINSQLDELAAKA